MRQSLVCCSLWSMSITTIAIAVSGRLPYWLGGSEEIAHDATLYFVLIGLFGIFYQLEGLGASMLKCSGNMKIPSILNIGMCLMDVAFNYFFIYICNLGSSRVDNRCTDALLPAVALGYAVHFR